MAIWDNAGPLDSDLDEESFFAEVKAPEPTPEQVAEAEALKEKRESFWKPKYGTATPAMNMFFGNNTSGVTGTIPITKGVSPDLSTLSDYGKIADAKNIESASAFTAVPISASEPEMEAETQSSALLESEPAVLPSDDLSSSALNKMGQYWVNYQNSHKYVAE